MRFLFTAMLAGMVPLAAFAHGFKAGDIEIKHPYIYEGPPTAMSVGGYMTLVNTGAQDDALLAIEADYPKVMLHMSRTTDGMATMEHAERIDIPAGATVALEPGGYHVMFMGRRDSPLKAGDSLPATLVFENAGRVEVSFAVEVRTEGGDPATADHSDHSNAEPMDDPARIGAIMKAEFDRDDAPLIVGPISVVGDSAVAGWRQDGAGGRALLRREHHGWTIVACAGNEMLDSATYARFGVTGPAADRLRDAASASESGLPASVVADLDGFEGVAEIGSGGHHGR